MDYGVNAITICSRHHYTRILSQGSQTDRNESTQGKDFSVIIAESDIARFRQNQALQEQSARQALYGFASVATHASINARMEREADRIVELFQAGQTEEAIALLSTREWCEKGVHVQQDISQQDTAVQPLLLSNEFHRYLTSHRLTWVEVARAAGVPVLTVWSIDHGLLVESTQAARVREAALPADRDSVSWGYSYCQ